LQVSYLKFEPKVSNFPGNISHKWWLILLILLQKIIFCFLRMWMKVVYKN